MIFALRLNFRLQTLTQHEVSQVPDEPGQGDFRSLSPNLFGSVTSFFPEDLHLQKLQNVRYRLLAIAIDIFPDHI